MLEDTLRKFTTPARRVAGIAAILCTGVYVGAVVVILLMVDMRRYNFFEILFYPIVNFWDAFDGGPWFTKVLVAAPYIALIAWPFALGKITPVFERIARWVKTGE